MSLLLIKTSAYLLAGRFVVRYSRGLLRDSLFAALNLAIVYIWYYSYSGYRLGLLVYLGTVVFQYALLRLFAKSNDWKSWLAFSAPLFVLVYIRYFLEAPAVDLSHPPALAGLFIGISYLAFRSSHLVLEVRNGAVAIPNLAQYLGFCFFAPTLSVGPINHYSNYRRGFESDFAGLPIERCLARILVGYIKNRFLGSLCFQLAYDNLLNDGNLHHWIDLPIAAVAFYFYLYCNFSGFCDMAIGAAGLIGIPVAENFSNPFAARNLKEFWNRWHITLSTYMRDVVFSPLSKFLVGTMGPARANHAIAIAIGVVFLLIGVWHGVGLNFAIFGAIHAVGVVANHYYTIGLKQWLGRDGFRAYNANPWIHGGAVAVTFVYVTASLFFFANPIRDAVRIFAALR